MKQIHLNLQAEFPAVLTHRSGISKSLIKIMRPAFQHGIGPHRLAKMLRIMHTKRHDELQLQYYIAIDQQRSNTGITSFFGTAINYPEFPKYNDKASYDGFSPSANYISYVYSCIVSKLYPLVDQLTSMLDGVILKGDHSFKIINHMAKVNGVSTFSCLYAMLNEYEEIRIMVLSHSKKMENLAPQFNDMMNTYQRLGMSLPELFYTDNVVGDQAFLKEVMPSLCKDVVEVEKRSTSSNIIGDQEQLNLLPKATLPKDVNGQVLSAIGDIDNVCQNIIDDSIIRKVFLGFDCEWVVSSPVSLIQVCFNRTVYFFRVHSFNNSTFPKKLAEVISSDEIVKIGKNISGVFTRLTRHFCIDAPISLGKLELGAFCYQRGITCRSGLRLDRICGRVIGKYLPKTPPLRCGNWEAAALSSEQINYAALDAWIAVETFDAANRLPVVHESITDSTPIGTFVAVFSKTSKRVMPSAFGYVVEVNNSPHVNANDAKKKNMNVVQIIDVRVSGMLMDCYTDMDQTRTLESFGEVPFFALVSKRCLRTSSEEIYLRDIASSSSDNQENIIATESNSLVSNAIPSRILKDAFHIMQMIHVSLKHGMAKDFIRRFRDALFVVDPDDKKKVEDYLLSIGSDWKTKLLVDPEYIFKSSKRFIPPTEELLPVVEMVFQKYGNSVCVHTRKPLFNEDAWKDAKAVLEEICLGHVSDVKGGPPLYTEIGTDKNGLTIYRCARGTSSVEGAVHMNIVRKFASYNAGPRLTNMVLSDYRLYHNIDVISC